MSHTRHPRRLLSALALATGLATTMPARAAAQKDQTQKFDVEILVFANNNPDDQGEQWPANPGTPDLNAATELGAPGGPTQLGPGSFRLRRDEAALKRSGRYHLLLHMAWRQAPLPLDSGHGVHVHGPGNGDTVNGTVKLSEGRYLHLNIDLLYYPAGGPSSPDASSPGGNGNSPATPDPTGNGATANPSSAPAANTAPAAAPGEAGNAASGQTAMPAPKVWVSHPAVFRLHQERKLRTGRVQYFDQPHFGVLALVTPYTPPKPKTEAPGDRSGGGTGNNGTDTPGNGN